jgi:predicted RNase H-like HicB family nuclease
MPVKKNTLSNPARSSKARPRAAAVLTPEQLRALSGLAGLLRPDRHIKLTVVLYPELEAGGYSVEVPALPGCFTQGDTLEEALANAREAIECYLAEPAPAELPAGALAVEIEL